MTTEFFAGLDDVVFRSQGAKLLGGFYRAAGSGPRPTAILLHGVPGVEKNLDIAYALRDAGWNCLYFHYRGCWGSGGSYSFQGTLPDVVAATDWVLSQPSVDAGRLALVGNSFGGYLALAAGAPDERIRAIVSMCPLVDPHTVELPADLFDEFARMLVGVTGAELHGQWQALQPIPEMRAALGDRPTLLVTGDQDELFPVRHFEPLADALEHLRWIRMTEADHAFSASRTQLVEHVVEWLRSTLGA